MTPTLPIQRHQPQGLQPYSFAFSRNVLIVLHCSQKSSSLCSVNLQLHCYINDNLSSNVVAAYYSFQMMTDETLFPFTELFFKITFCTSSINKFITGLSLFKD